MSFSRAAESLFLALLLGGVLTQVGCFSFNFPNFTDTDSSSLIMQNLNSRVDVGAIQVTPNVRVDSDLQNKSGRAFYSKQFRLWRKSKDVQASFNTTFVLNIVPQTIPGAEGMAFILAADATTLPQSSDGQWLGIVNAATNGSSEAKVVAVELDTRKSYPEDIDDNHVGLDVNSIFSIKQVSLGDYGVNLSEAVDVTVRVQYDGKNMTVSVMTNGTGEFTPVISLPLILSDYLPEKVFLGFSASTGNYTELNCVRSWEFEGSDIGEDRNLLWVWITVPAVLVLISGIVFCLYWERKHRERPEDTYTGIEDQIQGSSMAPQKFNLRELRKATGNFNLKNKLGKGGFGTVYKGVLPNKVVAVKRVSKDSRQGKQEFIAEVTTIGSLRHRNLVKLIGWCYEKRELLIVYEYMPHGSLDKFIFGDEKLGLEEEPLSWERRHIIIHGVAQALDYLHNGCEKRVLHRDIKASNIMLDTDFNARLGDFGLARTIQQSDVTHHSTKEIAGTPGYMAPETFLVGRATVETDVYAFGVLVLEVICGRKPGGIKGDQQNDYNNGIVYWLWELRTKDRMLDAVDSKIIGQFDKDEMAGMLILGLACCHPNPLQRPSMKTVLQVITGEAPPPMLPTERPAFMWPAAMPPSFKEDTENASINSQVTFTELTGR
ncbi:probable L-type lectin-domain containing receptor kinase S.5 [Alnus glutinosa]|uniref:probable L-type lectin-domain containing receptor kinase S.5 n=1 Tax=Alnus glutinosa TaxID=3517 RepID=UPI002D79926F|nr:probable L-type lectin-domain containing receptor kinase S.5 [Alnus glutinosa]